MLSWELSKLSKLSMQIGTAVLLFSAPLSAQSAPSFPHRVTAGLADLRPEGFDALDPVAQRRGRELLQNALERLGVKAWNGRTTLTVMGLDRWSEPGPWWPHQNQRGRFVQLLGTFTSRVELLDGPASGEVWGIQSWRPYKMSSTESEPEFLENNLPIEFYLPTLQYFNELPFRLGSAPIVASAGRATLHGKPYERVFVTWNSPEPTDEVDQYVLWIDPEDGLIVKAHYTLRDSAKMPMIPEEQRPVMRAGAAGTVHFSDFRTVSGIRFPFRHAVTLFGPNEAPPNPGDQPGWLHLFEVESLEFDTEQAEFLLLDPTLPQPADRKP